MRCSIVLSRPTVAFTHGTAVINWNVVGVHFPRARFWHGAFARNARRVR